MKEHENIGEVRKTNAIYFWKIIFTYMIVLFHYPAATGAWYNHGYAVGWYIAVEFFFMVSGYLLYDNLKKYQEKYHSAASYTFHRIRHIWPRYIIAFIFVYLLKVIVNKYQIRACLGLLLDSLPEILMLQGIGLDRGWNYINPTLWYISILLIAGYIICWFLMKKKELFVTIVAPLVVIVGYSFLYRNVGNLDAVVDTNGFYENQALIRGICDMCMGIFAVELRYWLEKHVKHLGGLKVFGNLLFVIVMIGSLIAGHSTNDFSFMLMLVPAVAIGFIPSEANRISVWIEKIAKYTLDIYLIHEAYRTYIMWMLCPEVSYDVINMKETLIYLVLVTVTAILLEVGVGRLEDLVKTRFVESEKTK